MEVTAIQSVEKNITMVVLANAQPSDYNPRKNFDEVSLAELPESIRQQGALQPIGVHPVEDDRSGIVFGERQCRTSPMAGLEDIPVVVTEISDEVVEEMAVTENLQRKDVTPIEETNAYQKLIDSGRRDVQSLVVQFDKNKSHIRTRLKFVSLTSEIVQLSEQDEIIISVASETCRYGEDIQKEVCNKHLKEGVQHNSWRGMKASDVARNIERQYTTNLERHAFDKTLCLSCPHNTNNMMSLCEDDYGNRANRTCLTEMNTAYFTEKTVRFMEKYPEASFCYESFNSNEAAVERLTTMGHEVESLSHYAKVYSEQPEAPRKDKYDTTEEYGQAQSEFEQDLSDYTEECEEIRTRNEAGEITLYFRIENKGIVLCYVPKVTCTTNDTKQEQTLSPVEKLEKQNKRNKEIALEKTVEDTKK